MKRQARGIVDALLKEREWKLKLGIDIAEDHPDDDDDPFFTDDE